MRFGRGVQALARSMASLRHPRMAISAALRKLWTWLAKPRPRLNSISGLIGIVGFCATVGLFPFIWHLANQREEYVEIYCPPVIRFHQHSVFGRFAGEGYQVRVYVRPIDGTDTYWLQEPPLHSSVKGQWSLRARFGNPYGWDHIKEPPLEYEVLAALVPAAKLGALPGSDRRIVHLNPAQNLESMLTPLGVGSTERCIIRRDPELCQELPRILQPEQAINPRELTDVSSPVRFSWEPNLPMFIRIWRGGEPVPEVSDTEWDNDRELELSPGVYELQARYKKESDCIASIWFRVLLPEGDSQAPDADQ